MSYNELIKFQLEYEKVQERLLELRNEKTELAAQGAELEQQYFEMLADDKATAKELKAKQKEIEAVQNSIELVERKMEAITKKNAEILRGLLDEAKAGLDREIAKEQQELDAMIYQLRKYKCEYLSHVLELHKKVANIKEIRSSFLQAAHRIGVTDYDRGYFGLIPNINLTSNYSGNDKMLAPTEREILDAYNFGKVEPWVKLYILTNGNEMVATNQEANERLRELSKDGSVK